ncbi:MAG: hypothetical protein AAF998_00740 [Bacteroidota bacterium]
MARIARTIHDAIGGDDFVAIACDPSDPAYPHAAFIIRLGSKMYEYHFNGLRIELTTNTTDYFHIVTETIPQEEVPSFIAHCRNIQKKANPQYGFFYPGSSYDFHGNHQSKTDFGEYMTCVGFCLNVMKGFLEEDYLAYLDWDNLPFPTNAYLQRFASLRELDIADINAHHRRITPIELLNSALFSQLPIRKSSIDAELPQVQQYIDAALGAS